MWVIMHAASPAVHRIDYTIAGLGPKPIGTQQLGESCRFLAWILT